MMRHHVGMPKNKSWKPTPWSIKPNVESTDFKPACEHVIKHIEEMGARGPSQESGVGSDLWKRRAI